MRYSVVGCHPDNGAVVTDVSVTDQVVTEWFVQNPYVYFVDDRWPITVDQAVRLRQADAVDDLLDHLPEHGFTDPRSLRWFLEMSQ